MDSWESEWVLEEKTTTNPDFESLHYPQYNSSVNTVDDSAPYSPFDPVEDFDDQEFINEVDFVNDKVDFSNDDVEVNDDAEENDDAEVNDDAEGNDGDKSNETEKNDSGLLKPTFKSILQAKKRLQAFSIAKQIKKSVPKEEKTEDGEKSDKVSTKKSKKVLYPQEKAKAVIQEIEAIKQKEAKEQIIKQEHLAIALALATANYSRPRSRSLSSERDKHFKRREIKSRNYRRTDSFGRKSVSPDDHRRSDRKSPHSKLAYPRNWTEYKEKKLTITKDEDLKTRLFKKPKLNQHELVAKFLQFDTPSPLTEPIKVTSVEEKIETIPFSFVRVSRSRPTVTYSVNHKTNKDSFISRKQLFQVISRSRRNIIEKLINTPSRSWSNNKIRQSQQWYSKVWKKSGDAECKILENSVGLSFLQNYSDEEEENETEEIIICSSTKEKELAKKAEDAKLSQMSPSKEITHLEVPKSLEETDSLKVIALDPIQCEDHSAHVDYKVEKEEVTDKEVGTPPSEVLEVHKKIALEENILRENELQWENTPTRDEYTPLDASPLLQETKVTSGPELKEILGGTKRRRETELNETRKAIKELEEELDRRAVKTVEEINEKKSKKKKKKKVNPKEDSTESEEEELPKRKKKRKKNKSKKKKYVEEDSSSSEDEKRRKKRNKKTKKKEKAKKKKEKNKKEDLSTREVKIKKKDDDLEESEVKEETKKKKKKSTSSEHQSSFDNLNKSLEGSKKKNKKKSKKKRDKDFEKTSHETESDDAIEEKKNLKNVLEEESYKLVEKKRRKKTKCENDAECGEIFEEEHFTEKGKTKLRKTRELEEQEHKPKKTHNDSTGTEKETNKNSSSKMNFEKVYKHKKDQKKSQDEVDRESEGENSSSEKQLVKSKGKFDNTSKLGDISKKNHDLGETKEVLRFRKNSDKLENDEYKNKHCKIQGKSKVAIERSRKHSEKSDKPDKSDESKEMSSKGINEIQSEHDIFNENRNMKEKNHRDDIYPKTTNKNDEPDWINIRSKKTQLRDSDCKESITDKLENIILPQKEIEEFALNKNKLESKVRVQKLPSRSKNKHRKRELGTPDTDDYRENWEKDQFPVWESEDESSKPRKALNTSWESDDDVFERSSVPSVDRAGESFRQFKNAFDLEIPLNIKPFKRREFIDPDLELALLKRESQTLSEERRRLEIEKLRVKELELKVIREVESTAKAEIKAPKRRRSKEELLLKEKEVADFKKKGRWDKKETESKVSMSKMPLLDVSQIKVEKPDIDDDSSTNVSSSTSINNTSAVLENEYEEFMKAVTSSTSPRKGKEKKKSKNRKIVVSDSNSSEPDDDDKISPTELEQPVTENVPNKVITNLDELMPAAVGSPSKQIATVLPQDIPLIPMPLPKTEIKPVPVPSPQVDVEKISKPLINLSLSANITLDIASKLDTPRQDPSSEKNLKLTGRLTSTPVKSLKELNKNDSIIQFASPLTDVNFNGSVFDEKPNDSDKRLNEKPFVFTRMTLPSKKRLLDTSNLNLGDSDDEDAVAKSLRKLQEIKKENMTESANLVELGTKEDLQKETKDNDKTRKDSGDRMRSRSPIAKKHDEKILRWDGSPKRLKGKNIRRDGSPREDEGTPVRRERSPRRNDERSGRHHDSPRRVEERTGRRDESPRRYSHNKRELSPRRRHRDSSPRRGHSPRRHSPRRRSSPRGRSPPAKRRHSPGRPRSPQSRRRSSISPRRKSSPRSFSPKLRPSSPKKLKSTTSDKSRTYTSSQKTVERSVTESNKRISPVTITSPGLKRSVADSTISDDLLPQPNSNIEEYTESPPVSRFFGKSKSVGSPKRVPLDVRINQVLGIDKEEPKQITTTYANYNYQYSQQQQQYITGQKSDAARNSYLDAQPSKNTFVQVGNMVQILPNENIQSVQTVKTPHMLKLPLPSGSVPHQQPTIPNEKSRIVQVGNMLQIVPTELFPSERPPLPPEFEVVPKVEIIEPIVSVSSANQEKQSAETSMMLKVAEQRAEREKRRLEREERRKEKQKRRKEKEKQRQIKLKQRTENMIKKALQLEEEEEDEESLLNETPAQWPPLPVIISSVSKEVGKSILRGEHSKIDSKLDKRKVVQFADGVKPGEGTSPSGGEELSSPPPRSKKLPKEKRYKKTKLVKRNQKKKVKVKIIKKQPEPEESDEDDNLPPPSPPPGSPPPHIFPPRYKAQPINNPPPFIPGLVQQQQQQTPVQHKPLISLIMAPPMPPHYQHGPPHHGPPPPPPGPPHHHGPPHHGPPPPPPHHGPPPPPLHHGPPPPPPHHGPPHHGPPHHGHHGPLGHHHHGPPHFR